jgi:hypothetical protein
MDDPEGDAATNSNEHKESRPFPTFGGHQANLPFNGVL